MNEARIINLEIKFSHQEMLLDQLNKVVTDQQIVIQRLEKEILDIKRSINQDHGPQATRTLSDDKPPHY